MESAAMDAKKQSRIFGPVLVAAGGCMWGCMGLLVRLLSKTGMSSMEIAELRTTVSFVSLFLVLLVARRETLRIRLRDLWCFLGTGILSLAVFCVAYFKTIQITSLSVAAVLLYTAPVFVVLMSAVFFGEKITKQKAIALVLALVGCVFVTGLVGDTPAVTMLGLGTGLLSGFGYALYSIFGRFAQDRGYGSMTITVYTFLFASIGVLPFLDRKHFVSCLGTAGTGTIFLSVVLILFVTVFPYLCYTAGLSKMEAGKASVIASVEPVVATILGTLVFGEHMYWYSYIGIILVLGAIALINRKNEQKTSE